MAICKRLNPNVEVPEVVDLIQQIKDMLESEDTERIVTINESDFTSVSYKYWVRPNYRLTDPVKSKNLGGGILRCNLLMFF